MRLVFPVSLLIAMATPAFSEPVVIAHRGASAVAPENTASAIREALRLGAKVIEFDVRMTSDGQLVLFHDDTLDRLAGRPGSIESLEWAAVQTLDVGTWFTKGAFRGERILRFDEAVRLCLDGGATPLIEHKSGSARAYAEVIRELAAGDRVIMQSFDWDFLRAFRKEMPEVPLGALGSKALDASRLATLAGLRPEWVGWNQVDLKEEDLPAVRAIGAKLALWTVNDPVIASTWLGQGADAIITDVPDLISRVLPGAVEAE